MRSSSRRIWWVAGVIIGLIELAHPQRALAQRRATLLPGLRFGPPLRAGFALGVAYGDRLGPSPFAGPIVIGEVGVGGARASVGYFVAGDFASGIEVLGSVITTWGSPSQLERRQTLLGGEIRGSFFLFNLGGGVFRPTGGFREGDDRRTRYYLNIGLGI